MGEDYTFWGSVISQKSSNKGWLTITFFGVVL